MRFEESPKITMKEHDFYPYSRFDDALRGIQGANEHFEEQFSVRRFYDPNNGYILVSKTRVLDARGFAISTGSPLEKSLEAYVEIIKKTSLATS